MHPTSTLINKKVLRCGKYSARAVLGMAAQAGPEDSLEESAMAKLIYEKTKRK